MDLIFNHGLPVAGRTQAHNIGQIGVGRGIGVAPRALEQGRFPLGAGGLAEFGDFVLGREAFIGVALGQHLVRDLGVTVGAFKLADRLAIPIQSQPRQTLEDRLGRFGGRTGAVRVLDPQQELAAAPARKEPVEQRGARAADVQIARGRRGEAGDDRVCGHGR